MKKFIAMLLALVMVLSLVACGDKKDDAAGTDDSDKDSQDTITLKMHFVDPETAPFVQGGKKIAELVSEATDGRIQIEVLAGGSLGGERDTVELAMDNSLDIATCANSVLTNFIPEMGILDRLTSGRTPMRRTLPLTASSAISSRKRLRRSACTSSALRSPASATPSPPSPSRPWPTSRA